MTFYLSFFLPFRGIDTSLSPMWTDPGLVYHVDVLFPEVGLGAMSGPRQERVRYWNPFSVGKRLGVKEVGRLPLLL